MNSSFAVRRAASNDAVQIASLGASVFASTHGQAVNKNELLRYLKDSYSVCTVSRDIRDDSKDIFVSTNSDGQVVGFIYLARGSGVEAVSSTLNAVELQRIYVHPSAHGKGVGSKLATRAEELALELGFRAIWLGVWESNLKAIEVYMRWGYKQVGNRDFTIGNVIQKDIIMLKGI
ncbi:hypothetical protein NQ176_g2491 [Zarea fungicola]|uniref:Uncharacterized protein n=1 Tax=Zarea fungicola TaxID=93591 RepID=A0ACC1NN42_9HYPO|nr:hypothetical protein NQ176_g2491 [Lecanicillium fungicola]